LRRDSSKVGGSTASWALEDEASCQRVIGQQLFTTASKELHPGNENTAPSAPNVCMLPSEDEVSCQERVIGQQLTTTASKELANARHYLARAGDDEIAWLRKSLRDPFCTVEARFGQHREIAASERWAEAQRTRFCALCTLLGFENSNREGKVMLTISARLGDRLLVQLDDPRTFKLRHAADAANAQPTAPVVGTKAKPSAPPPTSPEVELQEELALEACGASTAAEEEEHGGGHTAEAVEQQEQQQHHHQQLHHHQDQVELVAHTDTLVELDHWTERELSVLGKALKMFGKRNWKKVQLAVGTKTQQACRQRVAMMAAASGGPGIDGKGKRAEKSKRAKARLRRLSMAPGAGRRVSTIGAFLQPAVDDDGGAVPEAAMRRRFSIAGRQSIAPMQVAASSADHPGAGDELDMGMSRLSLMPSRRSSIAPASHLEINMRRLSLAQEADASGPVQQLEDELLVRIMVWLEPCEVRYLASRVSVRWSLLSSRVHAELAAQMCVPSAGLPALRCWDLLIDAFPTGKFLADGAFKKVFRVWNPAKQRHEAVSVMDVQQIAELGLELVVQQEVQVSFLLSDLVDTGRCPNFVQVYETFQFAYDAPWGGDLCAQDPGDEGLFQYIRMEMCTEGDAEVFIKQQPDEIVPLDMVRHLMFQMAFSLWVGREEHQLRHYDVKLLNYFMTKLDAADSSSVQARFAVDSSTFMLDMPADQAYFIKLADYGSANTEPSTLGCPITKDQFQTLENSAPEQMFHGNKALQAYAPDTFALGLCMLHLCTGKAPYEELLEEVICPKQLVKDLTRNWESGGNYEVISELDDEDQVLHHTLYRFLVLFGLPTGAALDALADSPVWATVAKHLAPNSGARRNRGNAISAAQQFETDCQRFSLSRGTEPTIARARARLEEMPGAGELLASLVNFDPAQRLSMEDALASPFFDSLRETDEQRESASSPQFEFMTYHA
jgi:serine/threonine protein kinase